MTAVDNDAFLMTEPPPPPPEHNGLKIHTVINPKTTEPQNNNSKKAQSLPTRSSSSVQRTMSQQSYTAKGNASLVEKGGKKTIPAPQSGFLTFNVGYLESWQSLLKLVKMVGQIPSTLFPWKASLTPPFGVGSLY